jgi:hypothetical protein
MERVLHPVAAPARQLVLLSGTAHPSFIHATTQRKEEYEPARYNRTNQQAVVGED